jgi:hypothetical protein
MRDEWRERLGRAGAVICGRFLDWLASPESSKGLIPLFVRAAADFQPVRRGPSSGRVLPRACRRVCGAQRPSSPSQQMLDPAYYYCAGMAKRLLSAGVSVRRDSGARPQATCLQLLKQQVSRSLRQKRKRFSESQLHLKFAEAQREEKHFWQRRFYDFNVWSEKKFKEKLDYMHANPVKRGLVLHPKDWRGAVGVTTH